MARALTLLLSALLLSCGGSKPAVESIRLQVFGDAGELAAYKQMIAEFKKQRPGTQVELIGVGKQKDHMTKLSTSFAAGSPPDLFILNFRRYGQLADKGVLAPLGPRLAARGAFAAEDFYPQALEAFQWQGEQLCVPQNVSSLVVYYNRTLWQGAGLPLPAAGWNMRQFRDAAIKLTQDSDSDGKTDIYGLGIEPTLIRLAPFIWSMGGELVNDTARPSMMTLGLGSGPLALTVVKRLLSVDGVSPPRAQAKSEDLESRFARGALGMILHSRRYTTTLRGLKNPPDWDVAPFPRLRAVAHSALHADGYCMARSSPHADLAEAFVAYAISAAGQSLLSRGGRIVPSRISVALSPAFLDPAQPPASAQVFLDAIPNLRRTPNVAVWNEVETKADQVLEEWYYENPALLANTGYVEEAGDGPRAALWVKQEADPVLQRGLREADEARKTIGEKR